MTETVIYYTPDRYRVTRNVDKSEHYALRSDFKEGEVVWFHPTAHGLGYPDVVTRDGPDGPRFLIPGDALARVVE
jgi:hypothetical protein